MNLQTLLSEIASSPVQDGRRKDQSNRSAVADTSAIQAADGKPDALTKLSSILPGGLAGGAAAGGLMALLIGSRSSRKMAKKVAKFGGTAVLGGLAYKAYSNWQQNQALAKTVPVTDQQITQASIEDTEQALAADMTLGSAATPFEMAIIMAMIAAAKADGQIDTAEHQTLAESIAKLAMSETDKASIFDLMARTITVEEIVQGVESDEQKAQVYLSAYLAIKVDNQAERNYLNNLAAALHMPKGLPAYLEQQADQGVAA